MIEAKLDDIAIDYDERNPEGPHWYTNGARAGKCWVKNGVFSFGDYRDAPELEPEIVAEDERKHKERLQTLPDLRTIVSLA